MSESSEHAHVVSVRKIPKDTTDEDFASLFPDSYRAFMVKSSFSKKFRVGYVYYISSELAQKGLNSEARLPNGAVLSLKLASDKAHSHSNKMESIKNTSQMEFDRKAAKQKKARLIIRNLSFKAADEDIKKAFSPFGTLQSVNILTRADGKRVGCGFIQYGSIVEASKAIKAMNGKSFLGRTVALDWAVAKKKFQSLNPPTSAQESGDEAGSESGDEEGSESGDEDMSVDEEQDDEQEEMSVEGEEDSEYESEDEISRPKWTPGHDVGEGRTVFIRNINFDSTEEDLKELMSERYGKVLFARFVMDKIKEHPKGTAFVKFEQTKSAERAVSDKEPLALDERTLHVCMALQKSEADSIIQKKDSEKKLGKDKRNLHLAREGLIREGTRSAAGVSKTDLLLRTKIQKWKGNMLKDLSSFVSPVRLCVRNIPEDFNDKKLRVLFKAFGVLSEAKVIRDEKINPSKGNAELGFVTYKDHSMALKALRAINNNPTTFRKDRRPIVEFSIENIKAIKAREKRLQKSKDNNPNYKKSSETNKKGQEGPKRGEASEPAELESFAGSRNDPKQKNLPSHVGPKVRTARPKISRKDLKKGAKRKVMEKKLRVVPKEAPKKREEDSAVVGQAPPEKKKEKKKKKVKADTLEELREEKKFNSMVQNYKAKLLGSYEPPVKKKKWFAE